MPHRRSPHAPVAVVILAAGQGTRMRSSTPKVLHTIAGRSLVGHVAHTAAALEPQHLVVVVGHESERVSTHLSELGLPVTIAQQSEQRGTGDAVRAALQALPPLDGTVVVLNGDTPLLTSETLAELVAGHGDNAATVLTALVPEPAGLGRIVRDNSGELNAIVEERDADENQRAIREINSGVFAFDAAKLSDALSKLTTDNAQHQEYLTDVIALMREAGETVGAQQAHDHRETLGCNDRAELAHLATVLRDRINTAWMRSGVTMVDPSSVWLDVDVVLAQDVLLEPGVQLRGATTVAQNAVVGPDTTLVDTVVAAAARVVRSHCVGASIGPGAEVGPFAFLRPQASLGKDTKAGAFVEIKNAQVGEGSKVPHLTYVGDATIGVHSNIGASSVFVNYDGVSKHHTTIGDHCRTGSDTMFVAPVTIGDGAYTAAGTVITIDVPPGALAVARAPQRNLEGWVQKRRAGSAAAQAAARANEHLINEYTAGEK